MLSPTERRILDGIRTNPGRSRAEFALELGLSKAMLSKAVGHFVELGLVREQRETPAIGARGQPALRLEIESRAVIGIGINLTTRGLYLSAVDFTSDGLETLTLPRPERFDAASVVPVVVDGVRRVLAGRRAAGATCVGIAIAVHGLVDPQQRIEEITPSQRDVPYDAVREALQQRFGLPVHFESFPQAFFEASRPGNRHRTIFHLVLGFGIGGVLAEGTRIYRGGFNQAGNIGALMPEPHPRPSLTDLAEYLDEPVAELSNQRLERLIDRREARLEAWFDSRGPALSMPLSAVVQLFNPEAIVIGGELPRGLYERLLPYVDLSIFDVPGRMPLRKPELRVAALTGELGRAQSAASVPIAQLLGC